MWPSVSGLIRRGDFEDIGGRAWDDLVLRSEFPSVFQSFGWLTSWWDTFREPSWELMLLAAQEGDRIVGIAPLYAGPHTSQAGARGIRLVGDGHADYSTVIFERGRHDFVDRVVEELRQATRRGMSADILEVPESTTLARKLLALSESRSSSVDLMGTTVCPRVDLNDGVVEGVLRKESLRRHAAKLRKQGVVTVEHLSDVQGIETLLEPFFQQHIERWSVTPYPSLFRDAKNRTFYQRFVRALASEGRVVFTALRLNGRPVAFHLGFRSSGEFYWYKPSFDIRLAHLSPGEVLLRELFAMAAAEKYTAFDFLRGDEAFKTRFASSYPRNLSFAIHSSALERTACRTARRLRKVVRNAMVPSALEPLVLTAAARHAAAGPITRALRVGATLIRGMASRATAWLHSHARADVFMAQPDAPIPKTSSPDGARVVEADLDTLLTARFFASEDDRSILLRAALPRFRTGDRCYVAVVGERLAGYGWSAAGRDFFMTEVGHLLPVAADEVVLYDFFVFPKWRRRGYYGTLLRSIRSFNAGKRHWIFIETGNTASIKGIHSAGFAHAFRLARRILFGRTFGDTALPALGQPRRRPADAE